MRLALVLLLSLAAHAEELSDKERTERARAHYEMGRARFNLGEYDAAVREFEEGYRWKPQPLFLYNIGNAARRAGQHKKALEMYRRYLAERPDATEKKEVLARIAELEHLPASLAPELPPPQVPPPSPTPEPQILKPYVDEPLPSPVIVIPPPSPAPMMVVEKNKNWRHDWLGAALCAVGSGLVLYGAVDFGVRYSAYDKDVSLMNSTHDYQTALDAFHRANGQAPSLTADVILLPVGAVLIVAGAIRYAILARR